MSPADLPRRAVGEIRSRLRQALSLVPIDVWRRAFPKNGLGICYHVVSDVRLAHVKHYPILTVRQFQDDIAYLRQKFSFVSYEELVRRRDRAAGDKSMLLTVDDGFAQCATILQPLLLRAGLDCIFFIVTDFIDNRVMFRETKAALCIDAIGRLPPARVMQIAGEAGLTARLPLPDGDSDTVRLGVADLGFTPAAALMPLLRWLLAAKAEDVEILDQLCDRLGVDVAAYLRDVQPFLSTGQIRALRANGFTIGAHSRSHQLLQHLPRAEAEREIVDSCRIIRDLTGQASVPFAFPYTGADIDRRWLAELRRQHDFVGLFFSTEGPVADAPCVVQRVFGERFDGSPSLDVMLRRAWSRPSAWKKQVVLF